MRRAGQHGFTLVETLVAIGIVGFGLVSILTLLPVGLRSTRLAGDFTTAAFLAQQELDQIRARAQIRDWIDANGDGIKQETEVFESGFDPDPTLALNQRDNDGLGYYDLPFSLEKGTIRDIFSPGLNLVDSETFVIRMLMTGIPGGAEATFSVTSDLKGLVGTTGGTVGTPFTAPDGRISFVILDNEYAFAAPNDEFRFYATDLTRSDTLRIQVQVVNGVWYAIWAGREDYSEDRLLEQVDLTRDGIDNDMDGTTDEADENQIDGVLTGVLALAGDGIDNDHDGETDEIGEMGVLEDTGLDMVPNFFDANFDTVRNPDEAVGEAGFATGILNDPHGDDGSAGVAGDLYTGRGTENNGILDGFPDTEIQRVTVTVVWREGGRTRESRFSTYVANRDM